MKGGDALGNIIIGQNITHLLSYLIDFNYNYY